MYHLTVMEVRSLNLVFTGPNSRCCQGGFLLESLEYHSLTFPSFQRSPASFSSLLLSHLPSTLLQPLVLTLCLLLLMLTLLHTSYKGPCDYQPIWIIQKNLTISSSYLSISSKLHLPCKETYFQFLRIRMPAFV